MNRYQAVVVFVLICHLVACTVVSVRDSVGVCIAIPTNSIVVDKEP